MNVVVLRCARKKPIASTTGRANYVRTCGPGSTVLVFESVDLSSLPVAWGAESSEHRTDAGASPTSVCSPAISPPTCLGRRFLLAEARYRATFLRFGRIAPGQRGYQHGERRINAAARVMQRRADRILANTPTTIADIVDRAIVARSAMTECSDGQWRELASDQSDEKAVAELVLAALTLAGFTDGKVERMGRNAVLLKQPRP